MKAICFNTIQVWYFTTPGYLRSSLLRTQGKDTTAFRSSADIIALAVNTLRPRQNSQHFPDGILKYIFLNEVVWIFINISLEFVSNGPVDNIPALVRVMAWRRLGEKPLSEPIVVSLLTHIFVTRPHWVKFGERKPQITENTVSSPDEYLRNIISPHKWRFVSRFHLWIPLTKGQ